MLRLNKARVHELLAASGQSGRHQVEALPWGNELWPAFMKQTIVYATAPSGAQSRMYVVYNAYRYPVASSHFYRGYIWLSIGCSASFIKDIHYGLPHREVRWWKRSHSWSDLVFQTFLRKILSSNYGQFVLIHNWNRKQLALNLCVCTIFSTSLQSRFIHCVISKFVIL